MRMLAYAILFFLLISFSFRQTALAGTNPVPGPGDITGKITDASSSAPLEFATISIYTTDSVLETGGISIADGTFTVRAKPGNYYALVQFISYNELYVDNIHISSHNRTVNLGNIQLNPSSLNLDEVSVVGEKSEMVLSLDKKVFNVGKDLSNTGKTALDILDNVPSVTVDLDGNVSLRGSENLQILVDGKPSGLVSAGNTSSLRNLQGNMIERIEIITNPSARYEAKGMAGIINIVLKKDQQKGVNGSFELTAGYPYNLSAGANVNFRREKVNYFVNYNIRYNERPRGGSSHQVFTLPDTSYITLMEQESNRTGLSNRIRGGADFFISPTSTITTALLFAVDKQVNSTGILYNDYSYDANIRFPETPGNLIYRTSREETENEPETDIEFSLNYEKKFKKQDHKFIALAQYVSDAETESADITETVESYLTSPFMTSVSSPQRVRNEENESNLLLQADYIYPFAAKGKFETGFRSEFRNINNPYLVEVENEPETWATLTEYSNHFEYVENIHAMYLQAGNQFNKFSLQAGLRAELSDVTTYLYESDSTNKRFYIDFFPSLHTSFQITPLHSIQLSYSRRINRPHFWLLNPFSSYTDARNFRSGNPQLNPEYTHSLELGYLFRKDKFDIYSGIYYRYTTNAIERVNEIDEVTGITVVRPQNLDHRISYGFEANATITPVKWWTLSGDFNFYRFMMEGTYAGQHYTSDDYSWNTRFNSRFRLPKGTDMQVIFFYRAPQENTQGERDAFYMLNAAVSKDILKGKGTLTFNVRDVLNSMRFSYTLNQEYLTSTSEHHHMGTQYSLSFNYRLNQLKRMGKGGRPGENGTGNSDFGGEDMEF